MESQNDDELEYDLNPRDLSRNEDLSVGLMNLISIEEHLFFTYEKTGNNRYLELLSEIRRIRTESMDEIVNDPDGEEWCISKHLLSASMRLRETGDKLLEEDIEKAKNFYDKSFSLYSIFWAINLETSGSRQDQDKVSDMNNAGERTSEDLSGQKETNLLENARRMVKKAVDCCKEI